MEDEPLRLLWAMTLGWRTAFTGDISEPFLRAGTMHLFAIDGLRIALISGMLVALLRVLQVSRGWCGPSPSRLIWFYTAATGWESSAIRASVMMTIVLGGWALKRPGDTINSLAAAAFIILLWEPRQLFEASFQLSFFVVLVIALMLPPLNQLFDRLLRHDPLLPDELLPRWRRALNADAADARALLRAFVRGVGRFHSARGKIFSPVQPGFDAGQHRRRAARHAGADEQSRRARLRHWLPWVTELFNHSAWFFMVAMTWVSEVATKIPGAFFYVPEPSWLEIGIYYAVLVGVLSGWLFGAATKDLERGGFDSDRRRLRLALANHARRNQIDGPAAQRRAFGVCGRAGRKNDWLVDCGNDNAVEFTLKPFLRAQGVNRIPRLVLTHGDLKNCRRRGTARPAFRRRRTCGPAPPSFARRLTATPLPNLKNRRPATKFSTAATQPAAGRCCIPAPTNDFPRADDNALVLLGDFSGAKILLLSDLGRAGQSALLARTNDLRADIVIAGLPDEGEPLGDALLDAIQPKVIVIADSEFPATRRAEPRIEGTAGANEDSGDLHAHCRRGDHSRATERLGVADDGRAEI